MTKSHQNGFEQVSIGVFCETGSGGTPSRQKAAEYFGGTIPWVKSGELRENIITSTEESITDIGLKESSAKLLPRNTLLVALYGATVGRIGVLGIEAATNQAVCYIIPDERRVNRQYLFYALRVQVPFWLSKRVGGGQPNISQGIIKQTKIPLPPLPEQRRIADILDKADAIRRKRQEAKDASDCFALSLFNYAFVNNYRHTNQQKSLVEIAEVVSGVTKGRRFNGAATRVVPYLRVANVQDGFLELSEIKTIEALTAEVPKLALQQGDVVMTEGGDFDKLGRGALWEHNVPDCIHQNHVFRVRVNRRFLLPEYFNVFLRTTRAKSYFLSCAKKTSNLASINITQLKALPVPLPKIALQEIFVRELRKSQQYKTNIKAHTDEVNNLFNSLVQRAFRGEL